MAATRMTEGGITGHLLRYTWPLVLGNLFQLLYNVVDSMIAGRFIGKEALAAAGTAGPVMNIVILSISGVCIGAGVLMSEFFGAKQMEKLKQEMATTMLFGLYFSFAVAALGFLLTRALLSLIRVPAELMSMASAYLRIVFLGTPFTYVYNALAQSLKSIGDSRTPLKFLMFSSVLNAVLDFVFIGLLGYGIMCAALMTVISQAVSAVLCMLYVSRRVPSLQLSRGEWRMNRVLLRQTLRYGSVTALQSACQPLAKLLIQGAVNPLGVDVIAAFHVVERVDEFALLPERSLGQTMTTFVAQNRGAGEHQRVKNGFRTGLQLATVYGLLIGATVWCLREPLMRLFASGNDADALVRYGGSYLSLMTFFYLLPSLTNCIQGFFRGLGNLRMTLICTTIQASLRAVFTYVLTPSMGIRGIALACAIGWTVMMLYEIPFLVRALSVTGQSNAKKFEKISKRP